MEEEEKEEKDRNHGINKTVKNFFNSEIWVQS